VGQKRPAVGGVEVHLLGPLETSRNGRPVSLGGAKPRALLAALAVEAGRVVSVDRLVESLWPGKPPETAGHALQVYVSQLRKALGNTVILTHATGYTLALDGECIDSHRFARLADEGRAALAKGDAAGAAAVLRDALALWRGPALADFRYEPFSQTAIARLDDLRLLALETRIDAELAIGRHVELVPELEALIDSAPLRERPRAQLMLALYRAGRQADALAVYRSTRDLLREELGIEPSRELKDLEAAILRHDESLAPAAAAAMQPMQFRRLVTILFADVTEPIAFDEGLDAEAVAQVRRRYFDTVADAVTRHGATVETSVGEAVTAFFGVPVSHEDDALRAARAALELRSQLATVNAQLAIRIGIESGEVVASPGDRRSPVAGRAVAIAAGLGQAAAPNDIVVGEHFARLVRHAAELDPLGTMQLKGKREPVRAHRLLAVAGAAAAVARRQDAPFVGRERELAVLRRELERAVHGNIARAVVVSGPPGVGKSRLAAEAASRAHGSRALFGRCLSYGEGITYWPLREMLEHSDHDGRDAMVAALAAETPPAVAELALAFKQFCEAVAKTRPLLLVFDDLHWGEPTLLDLVEFVAARGEGPMLLVCLARDELLEDRPDFLAGAERIALDALSRAESDALLDGLGGAALASDQRARVLDVAEGNPLFVEQLLALALESGSLRTLPATVQALLAARLDRLGPGARAVLERGAIVGKEFAADDVASLLEPEAAHTAEAHLEALTSRGLIRREAGAFAFRHVLVQAAVYRAAPKRLRAGLHARFAARLDEVLVGESELDELVGYHLEQAYRLRSELGESDEPARNLAREAGRRLGAAGLRALKRGDVHAATNLLERASVCLGKHEPLRRELLCELALVRVAAHDSGGASELLAEATADAEAAGDRAVEWRARIELEYIRLRREAQRPADELLRAIEQGIPVFERAADRRALGRAWLLAGFVYGGHRGDHAGWLSAAEHALEHYRAVAWPTSTCVGEIAAALYWGPSPVDEAVARCEALLHDETLDLPGTAYLRAFLGGLAAQRRDFDTARELVRSAGETLDELGLVAAAQTYCTAVRAEIELLAGDLEAAERILRALCAELERANDLSHLASRASDLAEALVELGSYDEADEWTHVAERHAALDDHNAQMMWRPIRARLHARRGDFVIAEQLAREAVKLAEASDDLNRRAKAQRDLGEVLHLAGDDDESRRAIERALDLYEKKGNLVGVAMARSQLIGDDLNTVQARSSRRR
jgi:DNA-binding SARP family transcriptional activator